MNRLRELRKEKKLTLKEVSSQLEQNNLKISPDALAKYERGDREPKLETWQKLADFFGVSVPYLQGMNGFSKKEILKILNNAYLSNDELGKEIEIYLKSQNKELPLTKFKKEKLEEYPLEVVDYWQKNFNFIFSESELVKILIAKNIFYAGGASEELKQNLKLVIKKHRLDATSTPISKMIDKNLIKLNINDALLEYSRIADKKDLQLFIEIIQGNLEKIKKELKYLPENPQPTGIYKEYNEILKELLNDNDINKNLKSFINKYSKTEH